MSEPSTLSMQTVMAVLGIDTGGTFTDFVLLTASGLRIHKVLSTPAAPEQAILQGIDELGLKDAVAQGRVHIVHGSTVATNAALEGKGVTTAFVTNRGFADLLTIGRQTRRELYNLQPVSVAPPVHASLCFETGGRVDAHGNEIEPLTDADIAQLLEAIAATRAEAVAINLLFPYLNNAAEQRLKAALAPYWFTSISSEVLAESGEYERGIATWLNASLGPKVKHYLQRLQQGVAPSPLAIMQSTGGTMDAAQAGQRAVQMLLSGPAGGMAAARYLSQALNCPQLLTFDMGGTSTDVALVDGDIRLTREGRIGPWPVAVAQVDMHTIGAGGGSIAYRDPGGLLQVGPESAGADPGPACYGQGGQQPTVTDANALLGRLRPDFFLGGRMNLDLAASRHAITSLAEQMNLSAEETAHGIIRMANEHMARALRVISVQRGHDVKGFRLCCFGGAGGLHVCALADALGMHKALVPIHGGVLSAFGMLVAPRERQLSQALPGLLEHTGSEIINTALRSLEQQGIKELQAESPDAQPQSQASLDLRYQGQRYTLNLPWHNNIAQAVQAFHDAHAQRFGHALPMAVELVNVRLQARVDSKPLSLPQQNTTKPGNPRYHTDLPGVGLNVPVYWRGELTTDQMITGPALVAETVSTTLIESGWQCRVHPQGHLLLDKVS